jgi:hypothetical protein
MKTLLLIASCLLVAGAGFAAPRKDPAQERRDRLVEAFTNMRTQTKWNLEGDMLWGFFFTNHTRGPLAPVAKHLAEKGYRVVDIYLDDERENWWLHVEKIEVHSVDSLLKREAELTELAAQHGLGSYDGWDVGPVPGEKKD